MKRVYKYICMNCGHVMHTTVFGCGKCGKCRSAKVRLLDATSPQSAS